MGYPLLASLTAWGSQLFRQTVAQSPKLQNLEVMMSLIGTVISTSMQKTAVVWVTRYFIHPIIGAKINRSRKFICHDEDSSVQVGDRVSIKSCAPHSKIKTWTIEDIVMKKKPGSELDIKRWIIGRRPAEKHALKRAKRKSNR